jgi:MoaA/NifB/PqqE/SkfB family radical SAM enzyme
MAGAIAGTALVSYSPNVTNKLSTITLTINNLCNLTCPHCYLQYKEMGSVYISNTTIKALHETDFKHLVVVGKEPFVNNESARILTEIAIEVKRRSKSIGVITNGLGLGRLNSKLAEALSYIDISFDGGAGTYDQYRKGNFTALIENIQDVEQKYPGIQLNALHVVNDRTVEHLDDMVRVNRFARFQKMMFSPYIETKNEGKNGVSKLNIKGMLLSFARNEEFLKASNAFVLLDVYHLLGDLNDDERSYSEFEELSNINEVRSFIRTIGLGSKVRLIEKDPLFHGFVRVTYDGYLLSPYDSLHTKNYHKSSSKISEISICNIYNQKISGAHLS